MQGAAVIVNQIKENEEQRIIDMEKKDQEKVAVRKHLEKLQLEDMITLEKKKNDQEKLKWDPRRGCVSALGKERKVKSGESQRHKRRRIEKKDICEGNAKQTNDSYE